jgi:hypothetical protein
MCQHCFVRVSVGSSSGAALAPTFISSAASASTQTRLALEQPQHQQQHFQYVLSNVPLLGSLDGQTVTESEAMKAMELFGPLLQIRQGFLTARTTPTSSPPSDADDNHTHSYATHSHSNPSMHTHAVTETLLAQAFGTTVMQRWSDLLNEVTLATHGGAAAMGTAANSLFVPAPPSLAAITTAPAAISGSSLSAAGAGFGGASAPLAIAAPLVRPVIAPSAQRRAAKKMVDDIVVAALARVKVERHFEAEWNRHTTQDDAPLVRTLRSLAPSLTTSTSINLNANPSVVSQSAASTARPTSAVRTTFPIDKRSSATGLSALASAAIQRATSTSVAATSGYDRSKLLRAYETGGVRK